MLTVKRRNDGFPACKSTNRTEPTTRGTSAGAQLRPGGRFVPRMPAQHGPGDCGGGDTGQVAHQESQIASADLRQHPLVPIGMAPDEDPAQPSRLELMNSQSFHPLAPLAQQPLALCPSDPSPVATHGLLGVRLTLPMVSFPVRFRGVTSDSQVLQFQPRLPALLSPGGRHFSSLRSRPHCGHILPGHLQRLLDRRRIAHVRPLHGHRHHPK